MKKLKLVAIYFTLTISFIISLGMGSILGQDNSSNYTSKVPHYIFDTTLKEQEIQLKTNPLMLRLAQSREKLAGERFRPIYHYVNPEGKLNDPNGLCYWKGNWHLFYQAYPHEDPRQHWGHAISSDLIHWRDLPYAIYPNPERAVYSGETLVEKDRVIAMYHGQNLGNMIAVSSDPLLLNWEKLTGGAVIPSKSTNETPVPYGIFDPCIWKKDGFYYSLSGVRSATGPGGKALPEEVLFRSKDLMHWEYVHDFVKDDRFSLVGDDGACPDFWPIGDRYILNFFSHMSGGQYLLGDYDKRNDKFVVTSGGKYNHGAVFPGGVHAPSATPDGKGGVVLICNMNEGIHEEGWSGIMTLPRRLTLLNNDVLGQEPAGDLTSLHFDHKHIDAMKLPGNKEIVLKNIHGNAMEIDAVIDPKGAPMIEINVLRSTKKEEFTSVKFFQDRGYNDYKKPPKIFSLISIESSHSSTLPGARSRPPETGSFVLDPGELLNVQIFIDKSVIEVFANKKQVLSVRVYPELADSQGVSIKSQGRDAELKSLDAWQMKSIYQ